MSVQLHSGFQDKIFGLSLHHLSNFCMRASQGSDETVRDSHAPLSYECTPDTVESRKFEVLETRSFIPKYQKFEL